MSNELTLQEAALAWAQGKRVDARPAFRNGGPWNAIASVGSKESSSWPASVLNEAEVYKFRLATEPPAKKFRPWTPEEVPVGALITNRDWTGSNYGRFLITGASREKALWMCARGFGDATFEFLLEEGFSHSTDGGKTWLPCGLEVEA